MVHAELILAGRVEEATSHFGALSGRDATGRGGVTALLGALGLVLSGRNEEAAPWAERALSSARTLDARPTQVAAQAQAVQAAQ